MGEVQEVIDTCDFFTSEGRRLYGQDRAQRAARQAVVHLPHAGGGGGHRHGRQLPGGRPVLVHHPGPGVRQRDRVEAGRVRSGCRGGLHPADPARRRAGRGVQHGAGRGPRSPFEGLDGSAGSGPHRQGGIHGVDRRRAAHRRTVRPARAIALLGARRKEPAGGHAGRRPLRPGGGGRPVQRVRHGRATVHLSGNGHRPRIACTTSSSRGSPGCCGDGRHRRPLPGSAVRAHDQRPGSVSDSRGGWTWCSRTTRFTARPATGRITGDNPRRGSSATPTRGCITTRPSWTVSRGRTISTGWRRSDPSLGATTFGTFDEAMALANGHGYGLSSSMHPTEPDERVPVPRTDLRRHGQRQQSDVGGGGPPPVRRQREVRATDRGRPGYGSSISSPGGRP